MENWAKLPPGWSFKEVGAVGADRDDNVYVFNRGEHPMVVFDREGNFLRSWGEGVFPRAHGLQMGPDDTVWLTDDGDSSVRQCTLEGKVLLTLGVPGRPAPYMSGEPFHRCTHTALSPQGEVYVADRENHRVQVFDPNGRYETQWNNLHRPCGLFMPPGRCPVCYIGELGPGMPVNLGLPNLGPRLTIVDHTGRRLARFGGPHAGLQPGSFLAPHGICVDSRGDIYVGEVSWTNWTTSHPGQPRPDNVRCLQKFRKV